MELAGHSGEIFSAKFDPTGNLIASGGMDRSISMSLFLAPRMLEAVPNCDSALANLWRL